MTGLLERVERGCAAREIADPSFSGGQVGIVRRKGGYYKLAPGLTPKIRGVPRVVII
jgi:hypothetical protein